MPETIVQQKDRRDPLGVRFLFEVRGRPPGDRRGRVRNIADFSFGRFSKISGLREQIETVAWRDGRVPLQVRKGIGTLGGGVATFEKGVVADPRALMTWFVEARICSLALTQEAQNLSVTEAIQNVLINGPAVRRSSGGQIPGAEELSPLLYSDLEIVVGSCSTDVSERREGPTGPSGGVARVGVVEGVRVLTLRKCFPVAYQMADLDAKASEVAIESLSVSFDELVPGPA